MGQRIGLSDGDVSKINGMYSCHNGISYWGYSSYGYPYTAYSTGYAAAYPTAYGAYPTAYSSYYQG